MLENNRRYRNLNPYCEPQLGRRDLYRSTGGDTIGEEINARLWVLNLSDGEHSLLDIAERSGMPFALIRDAADVLRENGLLARVLHRRCRGKKTAEAEFLLTMDIVDNALVIQRRRRLSLLRIEICLSAGS